MNNLNIKIGDKLLIYGHPCKITHCVKTINHELIISGLDVISNKKYTTVLNHDSEVKSYIMTNECAIIKNVDLNRCIYYINFDGMLVGPVKLDSDDYINNIIRLYEDNIIICNLLHIIIDYKHMYKIISYRVNI